MESVDSVVPVVLTEESNVQAESAKIIHMERMIGFKNFFIGSPCYLPFFYYIIIKNESSRKIA